MPEYHEEETLTLTSRVMHSRRELHAHLKSRNFKSIDGFYVLDRTDRVSQWQSDHVVWIDIKASDGSLTDICEDESASHDSGWKLLEFSYPLATVPSAFIDIAIDECESLRLKFGLSVVFQGAYVQLEEARAKFGEFASKLTKEFGEPGSETLKISLNLNTALS